ncbi:hypothetical protein N7532_005716 [Penicillium argentinense]|uniref:UBL3-like ubiquitin domain-containing protein n=1 Tax=Penicillium argentinense TaxID=1131581 RepID=A0A9W9KA75_9EURO|nr:uncharacterized protein N7532_005716 [Penicillium argentinense]KAJ5098715.1 hypothetical protein N7532_005716 [Penicillium argentinense]
MSSNDHPESGAPEPNDKHESEATTSPQDDQPQATATEPTSASTNSDPVAEPASSTAQSPSVQSGDAALEPPNSHPASGGDTVVAPMTATTSSTTTPANDTSTTVAQPQTDDIPKMDTEETKNTSEHSSEQSEDISGKEVEDAGPSLVITLLLTTGSRHPFTIDGKYLRKRSVSVENNDPFAMSVYTLKELIWREWRSDWETRPSSPSSIRLISFGKLLDDKSPLSDSKFNKDAPNVVHMTVKPQEVVDEEDAKGAKSQLSREREASERSPGCRCVIL